MLNKLILTAATTLLLTSPAFAGHCPKDAKAIDAALSKMSLSDETKASVKTLRDKGMSLHTAGNHRESEATMAEAMRMILTSSD
jgi:hypothetical protein